MRLEFNMVLIDDDLADDDLKPPIMDLITRLNDVVSKKGFTPKVWPVQTLEEVKAIDQSNGRRIDLYLSDNNLGTTDIDNKTDDGGILFYLNLKKEHLCDFILYSKADVDSIVDKLKQDLTESKNPNLFSRFTFVSRNSDNNWYKPIIEVINHMLTKREEINNLRGLYAQKTARIESHLRTLIKGKLIKDDFKEVIDLAAKENLFKTNPALRNWLHNQRMIRNGLMHNDEAFCEQTNRWFINYESYSKGTTQMIFEPEFVKIRQRLNDVHNEVMAL